MSDIFSEIAQRTGKTEAEVEKDFTGFVEGHYPDAWKDAKGKLANLDDEDLEFFLESYRVNKIRARGASSGKGEDWVGMIVGHVSLRDLMSKQRDLATEQAEIDLKHKREVHQRICGNKSAHKRLVDGLAGKVTTPKP